MKIKKFLSLCIVSASMLISMVNLYNFNAMEVIDVDGDSNHSILEDEIPEQATIEMNKYGRFNTPLEETIVNPDYREGNCTNIRYLCQACGWYGYPFTNGINGRNEYWCRSCGRGNVDITQWPFKPCPPSPQRGVCPCEPHNGAGHCGFVHDTRVMSHMDGTGITASDLKVNFLSGYCCWYCYDCKKHYAVDINKIDDSLGRNRSIFPISYYKFYKK